MKFILHFSREVTRVDSVSLCLCTGVAGAKDEAIVRLCSGEYLLSVGLDGLSEFLHAVRTAIGFSPETMRIPWVEIELSVMSPILSEATTSFELVVRDDGRIDVCSDTCLAATLDPRDLLRALRKGAAEPAAEPVAARSVLFSWAETDRNGVRWGYGLTWANGLFQAHISANGDELACLQVREFSPAIQRQFLSTLKAIQRSESTLIDALAFGIDGFFLLSRCLSEPEQPPKAKD